MLKKAKLILIAALVLSGCSTIENESKKAEIQKQIQKPNLYQKKWKLQNM